MPAHLRTLVPPFMRIKNILTLLNDTGTRGGRAGLTSYRDNELTGVLLVMWRLYLGQSAAAGLEEPRDIDVMAHYSLHRAQWLLTTWRTKWVLVLFSCSCFWADDSPPFIEPFVHLFFTSASSEISVNLHSLFFFASKWPRACGCWSTFGAIRFHGFGCCHCGQYVWLHLLQLQFGQTAVFYFGCDFTGQQFTAKSVKTKLYFSHPRVRFKTKQFLSHFASKGHKMSPTVVIVYWMSQIASRYSMLSGKRERRACVQRVSWQHKGQE